MLVDRHLSIIVRITPKHHLQACMYNFNLPLRGEPLTLSVVMALASSK